MKTQKRISIRTAVVLMVFGVMIIASCSKKSTPTPTPLPTITISAILGSWTTQSVVATKADGTSTTITDQTTITQDMYVVSPTFETLPSGSTQGTGNDQIIGEAFHWLYNSTTNTISIDLPLTVTVTTLNAHTMVWVTTDNQDFTGTYTKIVQTFTR